MMWWDLYVVGYNTIYRIISDYVHDDTIRPLEYKNVCYCHLRVKEESSTAPAEKIQDLEFNLHPVAY